ncbi:hypothetical protein FACS189442_5650 [Spirochaetia bacterium]|nr:hypothetical protein FACS189442_5650 [Spirochaetia bacterium]
MSKTDTIARFLYVQNGHKNYGFVYDTDTIFMSKTDMYKYTGVI